MGNDKSFYTLLNKYNTLLAQTQDIKEQLDKQKENTAEIIKRDKVIEKNVRDLCADILAKDPTEMKLGQEYSWDKIDILTLVQKARNVFKKYNEEKKEFLSRLADACEERGETIERLQLQIEELMMNPAARSMTLDELQNKCQKIEKDNLVAKKLAPDVEKAVHEGSIQLIHEEDIDEITEEEEDVYQGIEDLNKKEAEKVMANSIPKMTAREKVQKIKNKKKPLIAMENYQDTIDQLDDTSKLMMHVIGTQGLSRMTEIMAECSKQDPTVSPSRLRNTGKFLIGHQILEEREVKIQTKFLVEKFTKKGRAVYDAVFQEKPVISEAERVEAEHDNLIHGYGILNVAEIIRNHDDFVSVNEWNRKQPIHISDGNEYIPDIVCEMKGGRKLYIEYECANHSQVNFNGKCNKMLRVTSTLNFIVPNREAEEKISSQVRQWINNKGITSINHATVRITTATKISDKNLIENSSWHLVYNLAKSVVPEVNN